MIGIIAALGFWIPVVGALAGLVALILGIVAWVKASKGTAGGKPMAIIGTILGVLALLGGILVTVLVIWFASSVDDCYDPDFTDAQIQQCIEDQVNDRFGVE